MPTKQGVRLNDMQGRSLILGEARSYKKEESFNLPDARPLDTPPELDDLLPKHGVLAISCVRVRSMPAAMPCAVSRSSFRNERMIDYFPGRRSRWRVGRLPRRLRWPRSCQITADIATGRFYWPDVR